MNKIPKTAEEWLQARIEGMDAPKIMQKDESELSPSGSICARYLSEIRATCFR
jgi:hypothetical protein